MNEPLVQPLPYKHRTWFFRILLTIFICSVPVFIFYAAGYRINMDDPDRSIVSVGGIFVSAEAENTAIYLNEELVENYRLFQRAAYVQNLPAGLHRLHVQGEGLHTWVKELPVYPHIVTEAQSFNMPVTPQVRIITPWQTATGTQVLLGATSSEPLVHTVEYRSERIATSTTATSSFIGNEEFVFVEELFSATSTLQRATLRTRIQDQIEDTFAFSTEVGTSSATTSNQLPATTTREISNRRLYESQDELFVRWLGNTDDAPYYFCVNLGSGSSSALFTAYIAQNIANVVASSRELQTRGDFTCRDTIAIDTQDKEVLLFDFFPGNSDVLLVQLEDGLYAIEIDDRAWQNSQLLYPGTDIQVVFDNQRMYIFDNGQYFELLTTLEQ